MRAGDLTSRVTIQQRSTTPDAWGQPTETWSEVVTCWANIRHNSGAEAIKGDAEISVVKASIRIRWRTGITSAMRVVFGSATYAIKAVMPDHQRREFVDLVCELNQ